MTTRQLRMAFFLRGALVAFLLFLCAPARSAEILTDDGQTFRGKILEEDAASVLMEIEDGVEVRINKSEITYLQREEGGGKPAVSDYPLLGLTFGAPAVFNGVAGYYWPGFGVKVSLGYWVEFWGAQADLSKTLVQNRSFQLDLSLVGGHAEGQGNVVSHTNWSYYGLGLDANVGDLGLELDVVTGDKANTLAFPFQVGYVHRFD